MTYWPSVHTFQISAVDLYITEQLLLSLSPTFSELSLTHLCYSGTLDFFMTSCHIFPREFHMFHLHCTVKSHRSLISILCFELWLLIFWWQIWPHTSYLYHNFDTTDNTVFKLPPVVLKTCTEVISTQSNVIQLGTKKKFVPGTECLFVHK